MKRRSTLVAAALGSALALAMSACGGNSSNTGTGGGGAAGAASFDAGVGKVFNPADTYYGYSWNFIRLYGRSLVMFAPAPGAGGVKLVPDLAETLGVPSDNAQTWTYKIRKGVKFEDGTPVTSKDVKYGVERSLDKDTFPNGPTYFNDFLDLKGYTSPYKDSSPDKLGLKAITTPDDQTIVFHLNKPFGGFDYFAMLPPTIPVPRPPKDTGAKYKEHVVSTGPYMFQSNSLGKSFVLVRNPNWDSAVIARLWYTSINPDVAPLDNIHCRKAIEYAADHSGYQRAYGGDVGGEIATNLMPPLIPGAQKFDLYNFGSKPTGDQDTAKQELQQCGQPNGFSTNLSYRAERPKEKATAESLQQSLAKVGIKLTLKPYPQGDYYKLYAGKPDFAKKAGLGMMITGWGADWPDGFGFLQQIVDSRAIKASGGNSNLSVKIPEVDALLDQALKITDAKQREPLWGQIDLKLMENAVILPGVWAKGLLYRPPNLRNVFVTDGFQMYDYLALGVK